MSLKIYVDACFSWRVANMLRELGHDVTHVDSLRELKSFDPKIWRLAEINNAVVFSKVKDFLNYCNERSRAKLLFYAGFNSKRSQLLAELKEKLPDALAKLEAGEHLVIIR